MLNTGVPVETRDAAVVILAAGRSSRMKELKAFLPFRDNVNFIEQIASTYYNWGCSQIVVVAGREAMLRLEQHAGIQSAATLVVNDHPEHERFYSVKLGVGAVQKASFCFIQNVDNPFIDSPILDVIYEQRSEDQYVSPVFDNKRGHPVLLNRKNMECIAVWSENSANFKEVLNTMQCRDVRMPDEKVLININSPEEYQRFFIH